MEYTPEQQAEFKRLFAERKRRQMMVAFTFVAVIVAFAAFAGRGEAGGQSLGGVPFLLWGTIFFGLVIGALAFSFRNWRCPACDRYLGREMSPRFCSNCGVALQ